MAKPITVGAIHDTDDNVVHVPDPATFQGGGVENIDEFVAWLNTKAGKARFAVLTATPMIRSARGGMNRRYTEYLNGEPAVRIRAALRHLLADWSGYGRHAVAVAQRDGGGWEVPGAIEKIKAIAAHANVPFNDARQALFDYLKAELGDVMDRVVFPPQDAVRPEHDSTDQSGHDPYPVHL